MRGMIANGEKILALRKAAGLTQETLAAETQCDAKTVRSAERSKRLDVATLLRIAKRLGVDFREIVDGGSLDPRDVNLAAAKNWIRAFNARDPDAVSQCFHDDGRVIVLADPSLPGTGEFRSVEEIRRWAQICFQAFLAEQITEEMCSADAAGDFVFVRVEQPVVEHQPTGKRAQVSVMWEFQLSSGKIATLRIYPQSGAIERMVLDSRPSVNVI